jgi:hypothetical protein
MALIVSRKVGRRNVNDRPFVNVAGRNEIGMYEFAQPRCGLGV